MRRNWIQFNTRGPRACRQARCLLLARLAPPPYHLSDLCLCAPGDCVRALARVCACVCVWLKKPEPLLESGHDLAVTHGNSKRRSGERERPPSGVGPDAEKQAGALSPPSQRHEAMAPPRRFHREPLVCYLLDPRQYLQAGWWGRV